MELTKLPNIGPELARLLTALESAVQGVRKSQLTPEHRAELRAFFDGLPD